MSSLYSKKCIFRNSFSNYIPATSESSDLGKSFSWLIQEETLSLWFLPGLKTFIIILYSFFYTRYLGHREASVIFTWQHNHTLNEDVEVGENDF